MLQDQSHLWMQDMGFGLQFNGGRRLLALVIPGTDKLDQQSFALNSRSVLEWQFQSRCGRANRLFASTP